MKDPNERLEFVAERMWQAEMTRSGPFDISRNTWDDVDDDTAGRYLRLAAAALHANRAYGPDEREPLIEPEHGAINKPWQVLIVRAERGGAAFSIREHDAPGIAIDPSFWPKGHVPPVDADGYFQPDKFVDVSPANIETARAIAAMSGR